jgi:hypothetical protein
MSDKINRYEDVEECIRLMKSGEYPRPLLRNDAPARADHDEILASFQAILDQEDRYSFLAERTASGG